jgi:hypothetical protein
LQHGLLLFGFHEQANILGNAFISACNEKKDLTFSFRVIRYWTKVGGADGNLALRFAHPSWPPVEPGGGAKVIGKVLERVEGGGIFPESA